MKILLIVILAVMVACSSPTEQVPCDLFLGTAVVKGVARDFDGIPVADARVEFVVAATTDCDPNDPATVAAGETDAQGRYEVLIQVGNMAGTRCVFGNVVGSDSVSSGKVWFRSSCRRDEPVDTLHLDLVVPLSSMIPPDLVIFMYRLHGTNAGPHYSVSVDANGRVEYEGIGNAAVIGRAEGTVDRLAVGRLYRAFQTLGFWSLADLYAGENCDPYVYDVHYCRTTVLADGFTKQVGHDHGCIDEPILDALTRLECRVDSVLSTTQWTGEWSWPCR